MPHKRAKLATRIEDKKKQGFNLAPPQSSQYNDTPRSASRILNSSSVQSSFRASGRTTSEDTGERQKRPKNKGKRKADGGDGGEDGSVKRVKKDEVVSTSTSQKGQVLRKDLSKGGSQVKDEGLAKEKGKGKGKKEHNLEIRPNETLGEFNRRVENSLRPGVTSAIKSASLKTQPKTKSKSNTTTTSSPPPSPPPKTFAPIPAPRRLNDIVQAPPVLPHMKRSGAKKEGSGSVWGVTGRTPLSAAEVRILSGERERVVKAYRELKRGREESKGTFWEGSGDGGDIAGGVES